MTPDRPTVLGALAWESRIFGGRAEADAVKALGHILSWSSASRKSRD